MKVHVTGGSGFTGQFVIRELVARGCEVLALARSSHAAAAVEKAGATAVDGDLDRPTSLVRSFQEGEPEGLINIASLGFGHASVIVEAAEVARFARALFVSTTAIFTNLNACSKRTRLSAEDTIRRSALDWTIVRPTMIYGTPADRNVARLLRLLRRSSIVPLPGGGRGLQQPIHVADLAHAIVTAFDRPVAVRRTYNLAGPKPLTLRELIHQSGAAVNRQPKCVPLPLNPVIGAVRIYEHVSAQPRLKAEQLERLAEDKSVDISDARRDLGFAPRPFAEGVKAEALMLGAS